MLHAVIMAGGSGTRFWPKSRKRLPKQLIPIAGEKTMMRQAVERISPEISPDRILVITNRDQEDLTRREMAELPDENIIAEPMGRNTAPCIGLGAVLIEAKDPDGVMIAMPADHVIRPADVFLKTMQAAAKVADDKRSLITFGIPPTFPSTGYGYIHRGEKTSENEGTPVYKVEEFKEKPDLATAQEFVNSGDYYWNSGIFAWRVSTILNAFEKLMPDLYSGLCRIREKVNSPERDKVIAEEYEKFASESIDYGIMEKASDVKVIETNFEWDDVGSWNAIPNHHQSDNDGNTLLAKHIGIDTANCIVSANNDHLVATIGVSDLIVICTEDATLICNRNDAQRVKEVVEKLAESGMDDLL